MGEAQGRPAGDKQRRGRRGTTSSSVLTPPTGMPAVPDLDSFPVQRQESPAEFARPADPPQPPEQHTVVDPCLCGHGPEAHEHYRPGSDCGACGRSECGEYRAANSTWRRFLRGMGIGR